MSTREESLMRRLGEIQAEMGMTPTEQVAGEAGFSFSGLASGVRNPLGFAATLGLSTIDGAVLSPLEAVSNLPVVNLGKVDEFLSRAREGLKTTAEQIAEQAGMTDEEIASAYATGNFLGMFAPIGASVGIANLAIRGRSVLRSVSAMRRMGLSTPRMVGAATQRYVVAGDFMTEVAAGAIYGGIFRESDNPESITERATGALEEAAFFGAGRAAVSGVMWTGRTFLTKRAISRQGLSALDGVDAVPGRTSDLMKDFDSFTNEVMDGVSEMEMVIGSPRAMRLVEQDESLGALVRAIQDTHIVKGYSRGVFTPTLGEGGNPVREVARLKEIFPSLKMQTVKNPRTSKTDIHFSYGKGLSRSQIQELKTVGFYRGQQVRAGPHEGVFIGSKNAKQLKNARVTIVDGRGRSRSVKLSEVRPAYGSTEPLPQSQAVENLYQSFLRFVDEGDDLLVANGVELTSAQARNAALKGALQIDDNLRRRGAVPGMVYYPESLGLANTLTPELAERYVTAQRNIQQIQQTLSNPQIVEEIGEEGVATLQRDLTEAITIFNEIRAGTGAGIVDEIAESGMTARAHLLEDFQDITLVDKFDSFAQINGLEGPEVEALRAGFVNRYLDDAIKAIDEVDPETASLLDDLIREQVELGVGDDLEALATSRGMQLFRSPTNDRFVLRDIMSGAEYFSKSEEKVRESLLRLYRESPDLVSNELPLRNMGISIVGGSGLDTTTGIMAGKNFENFSLGELLDKDFGRPFWSPISRLARRVENATGFPAFRAFNKIDTALTRANDNYAQVGESLQALEKLAKKSDVSQDQIRLFYARLGTEFTPTQIDRMSVDEFLEFARTQGFQGDQLKVLEQFYTISDALTPQINKIVSGVTGKRYLPEYFANLQPTNKALGVAMDSPGFNRSDPFVDWVQKGARVGEVSKFSQDPYVALDRFSQKAFLDEEFYPAIREFEDLLETTAGDLSPQARAKLAEETGRTFTDDTPIISESVRKVLGREGWAGSLVSGNKAKYEHSTYILNRLLEKIGVEVDNTVMNEMVRLASSLMYGGTLAFRPIQVIMNQFQNFAIGYPRLGGKGLGEAIQKSMTMDGFLEARAAGAIRQSNKIRLGEEAFIDDITELGISVNGGEDNFLGSVFEGAMRNLFKVGRWTEDNIVQLGMIPFENIDDFNRTMSYHWQKSAVKDKIAQYGRNTILSDETVRKAFMDDALAYYPPAIRQEFMDEFQHIGVESAAQYLGKQFADVTHYVYGRSLSPAMIQNGWGRLFGMFGTFSMWTLDAARQSFRHATPKQRIALAARYAAYWGAVTNLGYQLGVDTKKFMAHNSWLWTGGPIADTVVEAKGITDAPSSNPITIANGLTTLAAASGMLMLPGYVAFMENRRLLEQQGRGGFDPVEHTFGLLFGREANTTVTDPFREKPVSSKPMFPDAPMVVSPEHQRLYGNPAMRIPNPPGGMGPLEVLDNPGLSAASRQRIEFEVGRR